MSETMIAYCGLDCSVCPAYIAYQTNDDELRTKTAQEWGSEEFPVSPSDVNCTGCNSTGQRWMYCQQCQVRACATERNLDTCAACPDFGCERLDAFFSMAGEEARQRLEALRPLGTDAPSS